ncbi:VacJ family lipoprotein [Paracoccus seriniphilus]|uniref:Phospholipid-binding lipoprotein MlaA n=2 Tax=Paracoccus seriniphilus TaxID=184748 RepID=A0A239PTC3_9RHOB|nr:VacJ family lipoprotein [Paracoccus seriniphilus]SNT72957.1 phospholipid-binding lipoprotein MlaA [Paracoccus seriniphilus]
MRHISLFAVPVFLSCALWMSGCAKQPRMQDGILINDPYEAENRRTHDFNKSLAARLSGSDKHANSDAETAPKGGQMQPADLVINMGANLSLPGKVVNNLLQGRPAPAARNLSRFIVNTTIGIAGMFDPAGRKLGLNETDTDFGETLAVWGVPEGAYLELPVLGPSTQRDSAGKVIDLVLDPLVHILTGPQIAAEYALRIGAKVGDRARFSDSMDSVLQQSADSYAQTRLIYLMHRRHDVGEKGAEFDPYDDLYAEPEQDAGFIDPYAD